MKPLFDAAQIIVAFGIILLAIWFWAIRPTF